MSQRCNTASPGNIDLVRQLCVCVVLTPIHMVSLAWILTESVVTHSSCTSSRLLLVKWCPDHAVVTEPTYHVRSYINLDQAPARLTHWRLLACDHEGTLQRPGVYGSTDLSLSQCPRPPAHIVLIFRKKTSTSNKATSRLICQPWRTLPAQSHCLLTRPLTFTVLYTTSPDPHPIRPTNTTPKNVPSQLLRGPLSPLPQPPLPSLLFNRTPQHALQMPAPPPPHRRPETAATVRQALPRAE